MTESVTSAGDGCLVTDGAAFIGSHLVDALVERGDRVTVIDNLSTGKRENLVLALDNDSALHVADIRDAAAVAALFAAAPPEVVFHLAAQIDVRYSVEQPVGDPAANVLGTISMLEAACASGARRFVNSSTGGGLYGEADVLSTREDFRSVRWRRTARASIRPGDTASCIPGCMG